MDIASHVIRVHANSRCPGFMNPCVHVSSCQVELPHECIGSVVEYEGYVVVHAAIATDLPAPHKAHVRVMNAMISIPALGLCVLDLGTQGGKELRDDGIAYQYTSRYMARHIQITPQHTDTAMTLQRAV